VEFGLGRFNVAPGQRLPSFVPTEEPARPGLFAPARRARIGVNLDLIQAGGEVLKKATEMAQAGIRPEGVDLNLDQFNLSEPTRIGNLEACPEVSNASDFWSYVDADKVSAEDERQNLLRQVFNPNLSDRRTEGDIFVCPDTSARYMRRLQRLVKEEAGVQQERKEHFYSQGFMIGNAGHKFPSSWSFSNELVPDSGLRRHPCGHQKVDPGTLRSATVVFDKKTEDGLRFRIYRHDNIEVRTVTDLKGAESIGAAFSTQECGSAPIEGGEKRDARPIKVTIANVSPAATGAVQDLAPNRKVAPASERQERLAQLIHSSGDLCADREVVCAAVERDGLSLKRASAKLRADREIVHVAVQQNGKALEFADIHLRSDRDIVLAAVQQDASALGYASEDLHTDHDIAFAALQNSGSSADEVAPVLRSNRELILAAVHRNAFAFELASNELRGDRLFQLAAVQRNALVLEVLPQQLRADHDFMLRVVQSNGFAIKYASMELRAQRELVLAAMSHDDRAVEYASRELREELSASTSSEQEALPGEEVANQEGDPIADGNKLPLQEEVVWAVVGGGALGGIVVRKDEDPSSEVLLRLAQGARVKELERIGERLHFEKLSGDGPASGWVSTVVKGKEMLKRD